MGLVQYIKAMKKEAGLSHYWSGDTGLLDMHCGSLVYWVMWWMSRHIGTPFKYFNIYIARFQARETGLSPTSNV